MEKIVLNKLAEAVMLQGTTLKPVLEMALKSSQKKDEKSASDIQKILEETRHARN